MTALSAPMPALAAETAPRAATLATLAIAWAVLTVVAGYQLIGQSLDYLNYYVFYQTLNVDFTSSDTRFESGFQGAAWFAKFVLRIGFNEFLLILAAVSLAIKFYLFYRYLHYPIAAALLYIFAFYALHEYTQIRVSLGIAVSLLGLHLWLSGRRWWGAGCLAGALLFHYTLGAIPLLLMGSLLVRRRWVFLLGLVVVGAVSTIIPVINDFIVALFVTLNPLTEVYVYSSAALENANVFSVPNVATGVIVLYAVFFNYLARGRYDQVFLTMAFASVGAIIVFQQSVGLALRIREFLAIGLIFLLLRHKATPLDWFPIAVLTAAHLYLLYLHVGTLIFV